MEGVEPVVHEDGTQVPVSEAGEFEVLKQSPILGDHKFKLEIGMSNRLCYPQLDAHQQSQAPTVVTDGSPASTPNTLSLYITSLMLDYAQGEYETSASMMAAIKCQDDRVGERGARPEWIWEFWQNDWVFRRESEVWGKFLSLPVCLQLTPPCRMPFAVPQSFTRES